MLRDKERFEKELISNGLKPVFYDVQQVFKEDELLDIVGDFDGWLAGDDEITEAVINKATPKLKVISKWGTGIDSIDLEAAKKNKVKIFNSPGAFRDAVAEIAIAYMLNLSRGIHTTDQAVRNNQWPKKSSNGLVNKTLGIIGLGAIGKGIAERALSFKLNVIYFDEQSIELEQNIKTIKSVPLDNLLQNSDIICLACNLTTKNKHIINAEAMSKMLNRPYIINVSRGPLISMPDLISSLQSGQISGAGLDVYEIEPLDKNSPLINMNNVVLGSHNANNMYSATEYVHQNTIANLLKGLNI